MSKYNLKLKKNRIDLHPFPFVVMSHDDFNMSDRPVFVERWQTREEAMHCAKYRQGFGLIVHVFKELAHSENWS